MKESGPNLPIPNIPETTQDCKDLLRALIHPDPKQRIEWHEFFNHKLFTQKDDAPIDMRQSVMFRNNEVHVSKLFN